MSATIGRVLLMPKGNYSGSTVYNSLDWVRDNGAAWVCKVDGTVGIAPPTLPTTSNANWQLLSADGSVSGSVDWNNVNYRPFDDIKSGGGLNVDASNELELDTSYLIGSNIGYDNTSSGMSASNVQDAIDELYAGGGGGGSYTASHGVKLSGSDIRADLKSDSTGSLTAASKGSTNNREYAVGLDSNDKLSVNVPWVAYESKTAASGGSDESLCTTGEKYTWNQKVDSVSVDTTGTASNNTVAYQRVGVGDAGGAVSYDEITGTKYMEIANTSTTAYLFTNSTHILSTSVIDVYTDTWGDNPSDVVVDGANHTCTVSFSAAQTRTVRIYIK